MLELANVVTPCPASLTAPMVAVPTASRTVDAKLAPALFYAPLPFLLWAAVRLGAVGTATALAVLTFATIWGAVHVLGPFAGGAPQDIAREMQLFLIAVSVPLLLLAVVLEERARTEREAHEQRLQLAHLSRVGMLGEMSGGLAHELNQPLTAILSNAEAAHQFIVKKTIDDAELLEILRDIIAADQRAGEVINWLRALFKRGEEGIPSHRLDQELHARLHARLPLAVAIKYPQHRGGEIE